MKSTKNATYNNKSNANVYIPKNDSDALQSTFLFSLTATDLLCAIVKGQINPKELAQKQLDNRGLNNEGIWVGFKK